MKERLRQEWLGNIKGDILSGIVVALALIPEAIGFSIIAGVDPMIGLYASFCMAIVISIFGGRPGMISAATGAMALVLASLVKYHGLQYMFAATILAGIIQIIFGILKAGNLVKFIPRSVMTGFVNSLAILIFMAQLESFSGESWPMYIMVAFGLAIIYLFPYINKTIPSPLVAIVVISSIVIFTGMDIKTVGDMGNIYNTLPNFIIPNIDFNTQTLLIILPYSVSLALVGLIESLLTSQIVDDMTDTNSNKNTECVGQGIGNIVVGLFGGMASCAMIGQSVINVKSGGRGRLSAFVAGSFLMFLIMVLNKLVVQIPIAALVSVMIMVSISTFDWNSIKSLNKVPKTDALVMVITVLTVVFTHNLAIGVILGVVLSAICFAFKISQVNVTLANKGFVDRDVYEVEGQLFFASANDFINSFDYELDTNRVDIDLSKSHIWDDSGVLAIDKVVIKYHQKGIKTNIIGLNEASSTIINKVAVFNKPGGLEQEIGH
jgi:sulfate permease, SulP family